jgi:hypothetical protein
VLNTEYGGIVASESLPMTRGHMAIDLNHSIVFAMRGASPLADCRRATAPGQPSDHALNPKRFSPRQILRLPPANG